MANHHMSDRHLPHHHFLDHHELERWLEDHDGQWITPMFLLIFLIFGFAVYDMFTHSDAFLLQSSIPLVSTDW
jgi:hypothetical protein